ncbi:MAG: tyrosine--tRNA ligase [Chloroflexi bacterium]|nr:tyrosine--tRNA ligase [Chloroflexota bacterium]
MKEASKVAWITRRAVAEIIEEQAFLQLLSGERPLRLKMGFDPSRPDLHLGHVVGLRKLRQLQELGHQVVLIVGDWTAQIGDPSGESATRAMMTPEEVKTNAETYLRQFFKVVDRGRTEVVWQSQWFGRFTLADVIGLTSKFTVAQFLQREDFRKRWETNRPIALTELLYPLLQAYDSVAVRADVEFGGVDQKFNLLVGRELQVMMGQPPQQCFLVPLLVGTDGVQKMSKSLENYIAVEDPPNEMYGKVMSLPDTLVLPYFELVTDVAEEELAEMRRSLEHGSVNPMALKKRLAEEITGQFWGDRAAKEAAAWFERVFQRGEVEQAARPISLSLWRTKLGASEADSLTAVELPIGPILVGENFVSSRAEVKRLVMQGAIEVDGKTLTGEKASLRVGSLIRVGKRRFARIVV